MKKMEKVDAKAFKSVDQVTVRVFGLSHLFNGPSAVV